jgi:hypothetical protein
MEHNWINRLERKIPWLVIPSLPIVLVILQLFGTITLSLNEKASSRMEFRPEFELLSAEPWRFFTFIGLPLSDSFWQVIAIIFLYYIVSILVSQWGEFKTSLYFLISYFVTITYSMAVGYPITSFREIELSLFLAAALLFPQQEILLFFIIPVKLIWIAIFTGALLTWQFVVNPPIVKFYMLAVFSNFAIFFLPALLDSFKTWQRRQKFKDQWKD